VTDQRFTINEGEDLTLSGDITGGFGDVTYRWYVSSDSGKHWDLVEEAHGTSLDLSGWDTSKVNDMLPPYRTFIFHCPI